MSYGAQTVEEVSYHSLPSGRLLEKSVRYDWRQQSASRLFSRNSLGIGQTISSL